MNEEIISLRNKSNYNLFGILHHPNTEHKTRNKICILLVHSGIRGRVGTGRQYVYYARKLAGEGYFVCRFDAYGMGDSEGTIEESSSKIYYRSIQLGRYVDDTSLWIKFLRGQYNVEKTVLCGLCGGAITSLLTGGKNKFVDGLILLNPPVMLDDENVDYMAKRPREFYKRGLMQYLRKLKDFHSILRFVQGKTDYHLIFFFLKGLFKVRRKAGIKSKTKVPEFNKLFLKSINRISARSGKILFLFGENDYFFVEFQREVITRYDGVLPSGCEYNVVPDANHMLTLPKWQVDAYDLFSEWLDRVMVF